MQRLLALFFVVSALAGLQAHALAPVDGIQLREQGNIQQSIDVLRAAARTAASPDERARAEGELGVSQLQARDFAAAGPALSQAYHYFKGSERARYAIHLGNLSARRKLPAEAVRYYKEALALADSDSDLAINAGLNLESVAASAGKPERLHKLSCDLMEAALTRQSAAFHLNLASQAWQLPAADARLAYRHAEQARQLALAQGNQRLGIEAEDLLASMYEAQGRHGEALTMTQDTLAHLRLALLPQQTHAPAQGQMADLLIALEWRQGRLRERLGARDGALAAYERAAAQLQASRDDIPIEYDNGRSSFQETIAPLYLGYAGLLLAHSDTQAPAPRAATLRRVLDAMEQIKQAELQDYLGDRCIVETVQGGTGNALPAGVAVLYPIIFPDRVELLLETSGGIARRTTTVGSAVLAAASGKLAFALRDGTNAFMAPSRLLYDWLLRPFEQVWKDERITTLVVVPDGALRLLPLAVLHDGERYAVEKFALSTVTGMTMTNRAKARHQGVEALVVGVSEPGPVVDKLSGTMASGILQPGSSRALNGLARTRTLRTLAALRGTARTAGETEQLRISLQLPGVKQEVDALAGVLPGRHLLNADFTLDQFRRETSGGAYRILHIASHGVFGGNAESSFIMAYDDVLTMDGLQTLLKSDKFARAPVELLTLSACETAEGNERAPLGMSGAAIKARAKSVLGTLWPLDDNAAQQMVTGFYQGLTTGGLGKAEALRQAQLALLDDPNLAHPFFWGSFILIGNWQ